MLPQLQPFGKLLIITGVIIVAIGVILLFADKIPFIGKLPGDIYIKKKNFTIYIPLATSILLSIILSLIFYFFRHK
jgi:uncharacterized protein HemY